MLAGARTWFAMFMDGLDIGDEQGYEQYVPRTFNKSAESFVEFLYPSFQQMRSYAQLRLRVHRDFEHMTAEFCRIPSALAVILASTGKTPAQCRGLKGILQSVRGSQC